MQYVTARGFKATTTENGVRDKQSNCDKCPTECLSLGCHGYQGRVLFNPTCRQQLPPLTNCPVGQLLFVCVRSGTEGLQRLAVLINMQDVQYRMYVHVSVCVCVCVM